MLQVSVVSAASGTMKKEQQREFLQKLRTAGEGDRSHSPHPEIPAELRDANMRAMGIEVSRG